MRTNLETWTIVLCLAGALVVGGCDGDGGDDDPGGPMIAMQPADVTVFDGQAATFSVTAVGVGTTEYQWKRNGVELPGETSAAYTIAATTLADDGALFTCVLTDTTGSVTSAPAMLTVDPIPPAVTTQPADQAVYEGNMATFSVTATGSTPLSYQWSRSDDGGSTWTGIAGATSASYTTPATVLADDGAQFAVVVTNVGGSITSNAATLTVTLAPPVITSHPADQFVAEGAAVTFTVTATGPGTLTYQWTRNGVDITGETSASYSIASASFADSGAEYTCVVSNPGGDVESDIASLVVHGSLTFDLDGAAQDYSPGSAAMASGGLLLVLGAPSATSTQPSIELSCPTAVGTYTTGSGMNNMILYTDATGGTYMGMDYFGSYSISVTTYEGPGGCVEGTFSGTVTNFMVNRSITNGSFRVGILAP